MTTGKAGERKRILVVDDSRTMRQYLTMLLTSSLHCEAAQATDGVDALEKLRGGSFDLMVTDLNMPRMDGLSLIRSVRGEMGLTLPILIITTKGGESDRDAGLNLGADGYVTKPITPAGLLSAVSRLGWGS